MNVHFIAIGGAIMHNLAICLQNIGHTVSGSDDIIFDPARGNLSREGLLPKEIGFFEQNIHSELDAVILGMHAKKNNVELLKSQALGIRIYSFPEFIFEQTKTKKRIVVAGSHGKTTTTAMIMHVMKALDYSFDYLVGSSLEGFDLSVQLSDAEYVILEGDEYLSSPIDKRSKFHYYDPDIAIITGIAWDHVNVFPTWESYVKTFEEFLTNMRKSSKAIVFQADKTIQEIIRFADCAIESYTCPEYIIENERTIISYDNRNYPLSFFGKHNLENMEAAKLACESVGISKHDFYQAISSFSGTAKRLEKVLTSNNIIAYRDFAHSPSKLEATLKSVHEQYLGKTLIACMELHTFSSTDPAFLSEYKNSMQDAEHALVYMSEKAFSIKDKASISDKDIFEAFNQYDISVCRTPHQLMHVLDKIYDPQAIFLLMSSGNFDEIDWTGYFDSRI
ncbi:Mur ligase family protein [Chitinophagales bacterium]|jgi:UDP-N-acetylmuramate: L-alanyl-gamma-D-glutamyl-meso-diaminopimelate ligase|nr:Mur ligase family protein [Chitinophagales bacterium]|tara:strand:+ start:468 stop:1814 length:1347 start_codon:yes stop_codon:yes gene_type:complete